MKYKLKIGFFLSAMLLPHMASAEWYVGAEAIESHASHAIPYLNSLTEYSPSKYKFKESNSISFTGGYRTSKFFAIELEYQDDLAFGIDNMFAGSSLWFPETESASFESNALFLSGVSSYSISDSTSLYMKGGVFNWEIDSKFIETNENFLQESRGTDVFYGLGANYDLNARFGISAEWERYSMEESDVDYLSTELKFKF